MSPTKTASAAAGQTEQFDTSMANSFSLNISDFQICGVKLYLQKYTVVQKVSFWFEKREHVSSFGLKSTQLCKKWLKKVIINDRELNLNSNNHFGMNAQNLSQYFPVSAKGNKMFHSRSVEIGQINWTNREK